LLLPEDNPGELVEKKSEDEFIRSRILTDEEFKTLYMVADTQIKRIIIAEMNAPLRKEDLRQLTKDKIVRHLKEFKGIQNKTGQDYYIPINGPLDELIRTAPGNEILNFCGFEKRWRRAVTRARLKSLEFRDLRRSAATAMHEGGIKLKAISKMLGHASVSTTERYLGLRAENLHEAGQVLANRFAIPQVEESSFQLVPKLAPGYGKMVSEESSEVIDK
jgi:integrase